MSFLQSDTQSGQIFMFFVSLVAPSIGCLKKMGRTISLSKSRRKIVQSDCEVLLILRTESLSLYLHHPRAKLTLQTLANIQNNLIIEYLIKLKVIFNTDNNKSMTEICPNENLFNLNS